MIHQASGPSLNHVARNSTPAPRIRRAYNIRVPSRAGTRVYARCVHAFGSLLWPDRDRAHAYAGFIRARPGYAQSLFSDAFLSARLLADLAYLYVGTPSSSPRRRGRFPKVVTTIPTRETRCRPDELSPREDTDLETPMIWKGTSAVLANGSRDWLRDWRVFVTAR